MFTFMKISILIVLFGSLLSCSSYNRIIKSDDYTAKFEEANRLYDLKKFDRSVTLYEQVYQRSPKTPQGEVSYYRLGKACYNIEDWYMASYYLTSFQTKFPYSLKVEETLFLAAICAVQNSPESSLDQNETELALIELQGFVTRFPNSERVDTCNVIMDKLRFKLEYKDVLNIRLYSKTENYRAATVTAELFLENYPRSTFREEIGVILVRDSYLLTSNSIDSKLEDRKAKTRQRIEQFVAEFPNSSYLREFEKLTEKLNGIAVPSSNE